MILLFLLALIGSAFAEPANTRVIGGSQATMEQYPFMANVQRLFDEMWWYHTCGGTIITRFVVLSAGHCFRHETAPLFWRVRLGSRMSSSGGMLHNVQRIVFHPEYDFLTNDVALLRLSTPAVYSTTINAARIAGTNYNVPDGTMVYVAGWGANMFTRAPSEILLHVDIPIINQQLCAERYAYLKTQPGHEAWPDITEGMLCAGLGGRIACQGDSGGPLIHQGDIAIGIVSFGYSCYDPLYPGVYARVSHYSNWIATTADSLAN